MSGFEHDPRKSRSNLLKHGVDFDRARRIWEGPVFEIEDTRFDYGETRIIALGSIDGRALVVVYTWRGTNRRLISARKANGNESEIYRDALLREHKTEN